MHRVSFLILFIGFISGCTSGEARRGELRPTHMLNAGNIPVIDVHSQVPHRYEDLDELIRLMDQGGVDRTILSSRGPVTAKQLVSFASIYPGRIIPAVRTKHRFYQENDERFEKFLEKQVNMPQFGAWLKS